MAVEMPSVGFPIHEAFRSGFGFYVANPVPFSRIEFSRKAIRKSISVSGRFAVPLEIGSA